MSEYDLVIIGAGPGGLTAGLYAARARMNVLLIEKAVPGGQILVTDWIENYPGFPEGISGYDLAEKIKEQALSLGLNIETAEVQGLDLSGTIREVILKGKRIKTKSLIIASGASPKNPESARRSSWVKESPFAPPVTGLFSGTRWWLP